MAQTNMVQIEIASSEMLIKQLANSVSKVIDDKIKQLQPTEGIEKYITRKEVASMYGISLVTVHSWINAKLLNPYKVGQKTLFLLSEVKAIAVSQRKQKEVANV
ncbi:MAG: helix-turn-helix domain-containing protein [Bacteroidetes bacterium]|nr:helix-turn-helix domain-containing protein [Bacteroidota bacterium]